MTNEEAIKCIEDVLNSDYHYDESIGYQLTSYDFEWLEKAKEGLKKQIPKKPLNVEKHYYKCPCCKQDLGVSDDDIFVYENPIKNYCDNCGQALDWSDIE